MILRGVIREPGVLSESAANVNHTVNITVTSGLQQTLDIGNADECEAGGQTDKETSTHKTDL